MDIITRAVELYTNPNEVVFTPFMGIGSEVYASVVAGRRGVGVELKPSYFRQACKNLKSANEITGDDVMPTLFDAEIDTDEQPTEIR